jgi:hypothetical protein
MQLPRIKGKRLTSKSLSGMEIVSWKNDSKDLSKEGSLKTLKTPNGTYRPETMFFKMSLPQCE